MPVGNLLTFGLLFFMRAALADVPNAIDIVSSSSLCHKTFADANATGIYTFQPEVLQGGGLAPPVSYAATLYQNDTALQVYQWYSSHGANYSNDFALGYDVCIINFNNLTNTAVYDGNHDNGSCQNTFDQDCLTALPTVATGRANELVANPSTHDASSNLTNGVLPSICDDIAATLQNSPPKQCQKYFNKTLVATGSALTDYNEHETPTNSACCPGLQDRTDCPINGTYYPIGAYLLESPLFSSNYEDFYEVSYAIFPYMTIFMSIANYQRTENVNTVAYMTCLHIDHFNEGSKVAPPYPKPPTSHHGLSGGAIAGIVIGVLAAIAIVGALAFLLWRRKKKAAEKERQESTIPTSEHPGNGDLTGAMGVPKVEIPNTEVAPPYTEKSPSELSSLQSPRPELPATKSHEASSPRPELPATKSHQKPAELP